MAAPKIKETAVLIGYDVNGHCVYSEILNIHEYYDREHVWDDPRATKHLNLRRVKGYLFDPQGSLDQEFESIFDDAGARVSGHIKFADGTEHHDESQSS
jgi:hypothetical protein